MKAIIAEHGQLWYRDTPTPTPGPADVLIRVHAAGVNPEDLALAEAAPRPRIAGQEIAGTVAGLGPQVRGWRVGDTVCALANPTALGAFAEWACVPASAVAAIPEELGFAEGASLPLAGLIAWQALFAQGGLRAGQRVLVHGAAGGVGCVAVQLALSEGAEVFGSAAAPFVAYVESLGVRGVVDPASLAFESVVPELDLVLDTLGGDLLRRSYGVLRPGGRVVSTVEVPSAEALATYQLRGAYSRPCPDGATLARVLQRAAAHRIKTKVAQVFPLPQAAQALARLPDTPGKVILEVPG